MKSSTLFQRHALSSSLWSVSPLKHVASKDSPLSSEMQSDLVIYGLCFACFALYVKTYLLNINHYSNLCVKRGFWVYDFSLQQQRAEPPFSSA